MVQELLTHHYDPVYLQSMERNFTHYATAQTLAPEDRSQASMDLLATSLVSPPSA